jgi:hypothetical protein
MIWQLKKTITSRTFSFAFCLFTYPMVNNHEKETNRSTTLVDLIFDIGSDRARYFCGDE